MRPTNFELEPLGESLCWGRCTGWALGMEEGEAAVEGAWVAGVFEQVEDAGVSAGGPPRAASTSASSVSGL